LLVLIKEYSIYRNKMKESWNLSVTKAVCGETGQSALEYNKSHNGSLNVVSSCWKVSIPYNVFLIQASSKQEVANAENFLYEPIYWPASALWAQEVPECVLRVCVCVCVCVCFCRSTPFASFPAAGPPMHGIVGKSESHLTPPSLTHHTHKAAETGTDLVGVASQMCCSVEPF